MKHSVSSTQLKNISRFPWTAVIKYEELSQQGGELNAKCHVSAVIILTLIDTLSEFRHL